MKKTRGFSLVEMMIATTLSVLVLGGVLYVLIESERSKATLGCMKSVQDNGRAAIDILAGDISIAGYRGCASMLPPSEFTFQSGLDLNGIGPVDALTYELAVMIPISGFGGVVNGTPAPMFAGTAGSAFDIGGVIDLDWEDHAPAELRLRQRDYFDNQLSFFGPGSTVTNPSHGDLITLRSVGNQGWDVVQAMTNATDNVIVAADGGDPPEEGDLLYIGDCFKGTIFMVTGVTPINIAGVPSFSLAHDVALDDADIQNETGDLGGALPMAFGLGATVATIDTTHYALGVSDLRADGTDIVVPALFRSRFISNARELRDINYRPIPEEIAPGVVDLGLFFGVSGATDQPPSRVRRIAGIGEADVLHTVDLSVQTSALNSCGGLGDDDNSDGWSTFTMRFERFLQLRNVR